MCYKPRTIVGCLVKPYMYIASSSIYVRDFNLLEVEATTR